MLQLSQLSRSFREGDRVHRGARPARPERRPGESIAIMGRSGSGKSTLLNLISGIDRPEQRCGAHRWREVSALTEPARTLFRRAHIGFVYQFFNLIPTLDVAENVRLVLELNGVRGAGARAYAAPSSGRSGSARVQAVPWTGCPVGSSSAWRLRAPWYTSRVCCWRMSQPVISMSSVRTRCCRCSFRSPARCGATLLLVTHDAALAARAGRVLELREGKAARAYGAGRAGRVSVCGAASARHLLRHPAQLALALIGLALGVGTIVAVDIATEQRAARLRAVAAGDQRRGDPRGGGRLRRHR